MRSVDRTVGAALSLVAVNRSVPGRGLRRVASLRCARRSPLPRGGRAAKNSSDTVDFALCRSS
jgi:hypothetical protein